MSAKKNISRGPLADRYLSRAIDAELLLANVLESSLTPYNEQIVAHLEKNGWAWNTIKARWQFVGP